MVHRPRKASNIIEDDPSHWVTLRAGISPLPSGNEQRRYRVARNHEQYQLGGHGKTRKQSRRVRLLLLLLLWDGDSRCEDSPRRIENQKLINWLHCRWGVTRFTLGSITQPHQLLIEMTVPYSNSSVAVDDIRLTNCFPGKFFFFFVPLFRDDLFRIDKFAIGIVTIVRKLGRSDHFGEFGALNPN